MSKLHLSGTLTDVPTDDLTSSKNDRTLVQKQLFNEKTNVVHDADEMSPQHVTRFLAL